MTSQETRTRLLEIALDLIWQSNYNTVGVNEICKQAGVTKGSFYHYFDSKATLFCEATDYYWKTAKLTLDEIFSPINPPLEQLKQFIQFIFSRKFNESDNSVKGCPYFTSGDQTGCGDEMINNSLKEMTRNGVMYNMALVRSLNTGGFLEQNSQGELDEECIARLISQYIHGAMSFARVDGCIPTIKSDLPEGLFRILGLKREYWFSPFAS